MAVKIHCSICDKYIMDVDKYALQKLSGEEICDKCERKVKKVYGELDAMVDEFKKDLTARHAKVIKTYQSLNKIYDKYVGQIGSFYTTRTAELDNRMKDVLKKED